MQRTMKLHIVLMIFILFLSVGCQTTTVCSEVDNTIIEEVLSNIEKAENFTLAYRMQIENNEKDKIYQHTEILENESKSIALTNKTFVPNGTIIVNGNATIFQSPAIIKNITEIYFPNEKLIFENYIQETQENVSIYNKSNNSFTSQCFEKSLLEKAVSLDPVKPIIYCLKNINDITILGKETIDGKEVIKVEAFIPIQINNIVLNEILVGGLQPFPVDQVDLDSEKNTCRVQLWLDLENKNLIKFVLDIKQSAEYKDLIKPINVEYIINNYNREKPIDIPEQFLNARVINY